MKAKLWGKRMVPPARSLLIFVPHGGKRRGLRIFFGNGQFFLEDPAADFAIGASGGEARALVDGGGPVDYIRVLECGDDLAAEPERPDAERAGTGFFLVDGEENIGVPGDAEPVDSFLVPEGGADEFSSQD